MHACVKLRLLAPTYKYVPHRGDAAVHNKSEKILRKQLYHQNKWNSLQERINYEQDKKNNKKNRKIQKLNQEHLEEEDVDLNLSMVQQLNDIDVKNLSNNQVVNSIDENDINKQLLQQKINDIKYCEMETSQQIQNRLKRAIKLTKKGLYKKADKALNDGILVNLNINDNFNKLKSKFPRKQKITRKRPKVKPKFNMLYTSAIDIIKTINAKSAGGKITISNDMTL